LRQLLNWVWRWIWRLTLTVIVLVAAVFAYGYTATWRDTPVPKTVRDDPSLPQVTIGGVKLHMQRFGDPKNPTVIVLHGGPGADFRALLPLRALEDRYHVIFYDQRGSGLSQRVSDAQLTLDGLYAELDGVVDGFSKGDKVRLIGHSWGAMLASGYLGKHPKKVSHAVLAEPGMLDEAAAKRLMSATNHMRPAINATSLLALSEAWFRSLHVKGPDDHARGDFFFGQLVTAAFEGHPTAGYFCQSDPRNGHLPFWRFGQRISQVLLKQAKLDSPTPLINFTTGAKGFPGAVLFMAGSCNQLIGPLHQRRQMSHYPRAKLEVIAGAGHTMFGERPEESLGIIRRFFARGPASAPASSPSSIPAN